MRGIATVISVAFVGILLFGIVAPNILEPIAQFVVQDPAVQNSPIDAQAVANGILSSVLKWGVLLTLLAGVASAIVFYLRRERTGARRRV